MHIKALFGLLSTPTLLQHCLRFWSQKLFFMSHVAILLLCCICAAKLESPCTTSRKTLHTLGVKVWDFFSSCSSAVCASRKFFTLLFCTRTKEIVMYEYVIFMVISERQSFILNTQKDSELFNKCTPNWGQKGTPQANDQSALVSLVKDNVNGSYL